MFPLFGRCLQGVVKPDNVVAFYPTRYDVGQVASQVACPVAAFFAEYDVLPGATIDDAHDLREQLRDNEKVREKCLCEYIFRHQHVEGTREMRCRVVSLLCDSKHFVQIVMQSCEG